MDEAIKRLNSAKKLCKAGESDEKHAAHKDELEAAYAAFAQQRDEDSNPADPGTTQITADVVVASETNV